MTSANDIVVILANANSPDDVIDDEVALPDLPVNGDVIDIVYEDGAIASRYLVIGRWFAHNKKHFRTQGQYYGTPVVMVRKVLLDG